MGGRGGCCCVPGSGSSGTGGCGSGCFALRLPTSRSCPFFGGGCGACAAGNGLTRMGVLVVAMPTCDALGGGAACSLPTCSKLSSACICATAASIVTAVRLLVACCDQVAVEACSR